MSARRVKYSSKTDLAAYRTHITNVKLAVEKTGKKRLPGSVRRAYNMLKICGG